MLSRIGIQQRIGRKSVTEKDTRLRRLIHHLLQEVSGSIRLNRPIDNAARLAIYVGQDEDLVFFSPMKVKTSSISMMSTASGWGAAGSCSA